MGVIVAAAGMALIGVGLVWDGLRGRRGKADKTGQTTPKGVAYALVVIGALSARGAAALPFVIDKLW